MKRPLKNYAYTIPDLIVSIEHTFVFLAFFFNWLPISNQSKIFIILL